ncbi:MAG: hypothetical protein ACRBCI_13835 [Cellvibrionaceae bacterium]
MKAKELLDKIQSKSSYGIKGYLEEEIVFLENLYDIEVKGEFKEFLIGAGRTSGCQFKNLGYEYYFNLWLSKNVRSNVLGNTELKEDFTKIAFKEMKEQKQYDLKKHRFYKYINGKPFHISSENLTQEKFILTTEKDLMVYQLDTNVDEIFPTNEKFIEYIDSLIDWDFSSVEDGRSWSGEYVIPKHI